MQERVPVVRPKRKFSSKSGAQDSRSAENEASVSRSDKKPALAGLKFVVTRGFSLPNLEFRRRDAAKRDFDLEPRVDKLTRAASEDDFPRRRSDHDPFLRPAAAEHGPDENHRTSREPFGKRWRCPARGQSNIPRPRVQEWPKSVQITPAQFSSGPSFASSGRAPRRRFNTAAPFPARSCAASSGVRSRENRCVRATSSDCPRAAGRRGAIRARRQSPASRRDRTAH